MSEQELNAIEARAKDTLENNGNAVAKHGPRCSCWDCEDQRSILALVAEVRRLRAEVAAMIAATLAERHHDAMKRLADQ